MVAEQGFPVQVAAFGEPARRALVHLVATAKAGDPFAPVSVVVPSALAGSTLLRSVTVELGGVVGVHASSFPAFVARLAGPRVAASGRAALDGLTARAIAAGVVVADPGPFRAVGDHPATVAALVDTFDELRPLTDGELGALAGASERGAAVVRLFRAYRRATAAWVSGDDMARAAIDAIRDGDAVVDGAGLVIVQTPRRLGRRELQVLAALHERGQLRVVIGVTGHPVADEATRELLDALADTGLPGAAVDLAGTAPVATRTTDTTAVQAPDAAEEVRHAVRVVRDAIAAGTPPERIAVVSRVREPYMLLAHEELTALGLQHSAPSPARLAQSIAGRTLLGLLRWSANGARRDELIRLLRGAPVRDGAGGTTRPDWWDRIARDAGVVAGLDQWTTRLAAARAEREARLAARAEVETDAPDAGAPDGDETPDDRLAEIDALGRFVAHAVALTDPGDRTGWRALARWARRVLDTALPTGSRPFVENEAERGARDAIVGLLERIAALPAVGQPIDPERFVRSLEHELDQPSRPVGRFGHGVTVGRLADAVGADLDLVVVVGAAEGVFPPRRVDDAVLPARHRAAVPGLRARGSSRAEEERDAWAALAGARRRVVTAPVADARNQREQHAAPWFLHLPADRMQLASFEAWLAGGGPPATEVERDTAELLAAHRAGRPLDDVAAVVACRLHRGLAVVRSRATGGFDEWAGNVGPHELLRGELAEHRSPTSLEAWAVCPFRYYLDKVLGVRPLEDPATAETIEPRDRGSLVHEVLERFIARYLELAPSALSTPEARAELMTIADEVEARYREHGRTGRRLLWEPEWRSLRAHLAAVVEHGIAAPELAGMQPIAVEHGFGYEGDPAPAVTIEVGDAPALRFGGRIDRIDATPDRRSVVVVDYKTSSSRDYGRLVDDPVDRGRRLQLPIYALAARALVPEAEQVAAYYWFVSPTARVEMKGGVFDADAEARFRDVLSVIVQGIEAGHFPARPGDDAWIPGVGETYEACRYCAYDRVCSTARADRWDRVQVEPALARYVALADGTDRAVASEDEEVGS